METDKEKIIQAERDIKDAYCLSKCSAGLCDTCHSLGTCDEYDNFIKRLSNIFENLK